MSGTLRIQAISGHAGPVPGQGTQRQPQVAKLIDTTTCIGCKACEVACLEWNDLPFRETVFQNTYQTMPETAWNYWNLIKFNERPQADGSMMWLMRKDQCMHCADPGCLAACPADQAIVAARDQDLAAGESHGNRVRAAVVHGAGRAPPAARRVIQLRAREHWAAATARDEDAAVGQPDSDAIGTVIVGRRSGRPEYQGRRPGGHHAWDRSRGRGRGRGGGGWGRGRIGRRSPRIQDVQRTSDRQHADQGGGGEADRHRHGLEPPRHAPSVPLLGVVDLVEGGIDHAICQLVRALLEVRPDEAVELTLVGHRCRPPATATGRSSASMAARIARWA
jgi:ferredoxin